jgi:hypothetical protein
VSLRTEKILFRLNGASSHQTDYGALGWYPPRTILAQCTHVRNVHYWRNDKIWNPDDSTLMHTFEQPDGTYTVAWHPNGAILLVRNLKGVLLWNVPVE